MAFSGWGNTFSFTGSQDGGQTTSGWLLNTVWKRCTAEFSAMATASFCMQTSILGQKQNLQFFIFSVT